MKVKNEYSLMVKLYYSDVSTEISMYINTYLCTLSCTVTYMWVVKKVKCSHYLLAITIEKKVINARDNR